MNLYPGHEAGPRNKPIYLPDWQLEYVVAKMERDEFGVVYRKEAVLLPEKCIGFVNIMRDKKPSISVRLDLLDWLPEIDYWPRLDFRYKELIALMDGYRSAQSMEATYKSSKKLKPFIEGEATLYVHRIKKRQLYKAKEKSA